MISMLSFSREDLFSTDKAIACKAIIDLKKLMHELWKYSIDSTEPFWEIPELREFCGILKREGMKDERVMWEDVVWMHLGVGGNEVLEGWGGYQEERVPDLEAFEHSFPVGRILNGSFENVAWDEDREGCGYGGREEYDEILE
jgi:hypothetical protein